MDVRYNSTMFKNSYGAGQAASQAIGVAIEWQTDQHQIVGFHVQNKLCKVGSMLRSQRHNVTCPGHERCSATLRAVDPISEYDIGKQIGHSFAQDNVAIRYVATDGDALASRGVQDAMPAAPIERMLCRQMPWIIQTTIDCYAGSCKNCHRHEVVCQGGLQNNWWHKSQHLKASGVTRLNMTDADRLTLQGLIEMRLGNAAL